MYKLAQFELFNSLDLDETRQLVGQQFCAHRLEIIDNAKKFNARHHFVKGINFDLNYLKYGATTLIEPGELGDFYLIQIPLKGKASIINGNIECQSSVNSASVLNPDRHTKMVWQSGCEQLLIYIKTDIMNRIAEQYIGRKLNKPIIFENMVSFKTCAMLRWRQQVLTLFAAADTGDLFQKNHSLNQSLIEQEILTQFLTLQPSNIHQFIIQCNDKPSASYVKKAQSYIIENAHHTIDLADISKAANVPIRTLQHGFKIYLNKSPIEFLRDERLMQIAHELASGHCNGNVTSTATKWGFFHFGRFSRYYRQKFGELPSQTMVNGQYTRGLA